MKYIYTSLQLKTSIFLDNLKYIAKLIYFLQFAFSLDRPGLRNIDEIKRLNQAVLQTLQRELIQRPPPSATQQARTDVSILTKLLNKRHLLRYVKCNSNMKIHHIYTNHAMIYE